MRPAPAVPLLLASSVLLAAAPPQEPGTRVAREAVAPPTVGLQVVDAETGAPIPAARVSVVHERPCPLSGVWWSTSGAISDAEGRVRLAAEELEPGPWIFVQAAGYAPRAVMTAAPDPRLELVRGRDVLLEVRDALERPVPGAQVGLMLGCGHAPDVRSVTTDARGRALLETIEPDVGDLWVVGPGVRADYGDEELEDGLLVVRCAPGVEVAGRLVDPEGRPLAGAYVGQPHRHRGPWVQADERGRFLLVGADWPAEVYVRDAEDPAEHLGVYALPSDGREVTLTVPEREEETVTVAVALHAGSGGERPHDVYVEAVRADDGRTVRRWTGESEVELALPEGRYELRAGGGLSGWEPVRASLDVGTQAVAVAMYTSRTPRITLAAPWLAEEGRVTLVTAREELEVTDAVRGGEPVALPPAHVPCGLRLRAKDRVRAFELAPEQRADGGRLELERP